MNFGFSPSEGLVSLVLNQAQHCCSGLSVRSPSGALSCAVWGSITCCAGLQTELLKTSMGISCEALGNVGGKDTELSEMDFSEV